MVEIKRAYVPAGPDDGVRVLIDRLWPRGITKEKAHIDQWRKDLAPSTELRKWFGHDPKRWDEFQKRYKKELADADLAELKKLAKKEKVTLVYGAHDETHNDAVVLRELLTTH